MKLSLHQLAELRRLARYFESIREGAEQMGVEVDTLLDEIRHQGLTYGGAPKNLLAVASSRSAAFKRHAKNSETCDTSIINLSVLVNEDRF